MAANEQAFIDDYLRRYSVGDEKVVQVSVVCEVLKSAGLFSKDQKVELQPRVLALGHYRLYLFPTGKDALNPKKVVDVKYLDFSGVESDSSRFIVKTVNPVAELGQISLRTDRSKELLTALVAEWRRSFAFLPLPPITGAYDASPLPSEFSSRRTGPFCAGYCGWSNYYDSPISVPFLNYVEELEARGIVDLDLRECPGIETAEFPGASLNLVPVFASLRFDTYFHSVIMTGIQHKEALHLASDVVRFNSWLTKIVVVDSGGEQDSLISFATALSDNKSYSLQMIDLSQHPTFGDRGMQALSLALAGFGGRITHLRLANVGASGKGIGYLMAAFRLNYRFSLGLQYLNLSGNRFDSSSSAKLEDWIERAGADASLQTLALASTGINFSALSKLKTVKELHTLDLSDCKVDSSSDTKGLCSTLESSPSLTSIDLSGCGFTKADFAEAVILNIGARLTSSPLTLKLAHNNFGSYSLGDFSRVAKAMSSVQGLTSLDLSGLAPRDEQTVSVLFDNLRNAPSLSSLQLDYVRLKPKGFDIINPLWNFTALRSLSLAASFAPEVIATFLRSAPTAEQRRISELDVSQNQLGDYGADCLVSYVRPDKVLQSLKCDGNGFSISGWSAIVTALRLSSSVAKVSNPLIDLTFHKSLKSNGDEKNHLSPEYLTRRLAALSYEMQLLASKSSGKEVQNARVTFGDSSTTSQMTTPTTAAPSIVVPDRLSSDSASFLNGKDEDMNSVVSNTKLSGSGSLHRPSSVYKFDPTLLLSSAAQAGYTMTPPLAVTEPSGAGRQSMSVPPAHQISAPAATNPSASSWGAPMAQPPSFNPGPPIPPATLPPSMPTPPPPAHNAPPLSTPPPPVFNTAPPPLSAPSPPVFNPALPPLSTPPPLVFNPTPPPPVGLPTPPPPSPLPPVAVPTQVSAPPIPYSAPPPPVVSSIPHQPAAPYQAPAPSPPPFKAPPVSLPPPPVPELELDTSASDYSDNQYHADHAYSNYQEEQASYDAQYSGYSGYEADESAQGYYQSQPETQQSTEDSDHEASRPGMSSASAAAIRREKYKSVQEDPEFGAITLGTGGGASPFDTFRLPAGAPVEPPSPFGGPRSVGSMGPPDTPPLTRLGGVHKPPPASVKAAPPAENPVAKIPALHKAPPNANKPTTSPAPVHPASSPSNPSPPWATPKLQSASAASPSQALSPPTSPRGKLNPVSFVKLPSTAAASQQSAPSALGIHKLPPGVTAKAPPAASPPKASSTSALSPPTSPRSGLKPSGSSYSSPNLGQTPSSPFGSTVAVPRPNPGVGAPKKIGFSDSPAAAPPSAGPAKTPSGHTKLSHHSRSISESHTSGSIVRSAVHSSPGPISPSPMKRSAESPVHHAPPAAAAPNPSVSALKQNNFVRSASVGAQNPTITSPAAGGPRPAPPGAKFPPSSPSKFPPAPM